MALTIAVITVFFIACLIFAFRAKADYPTFTDEQLLNQHRRFLGELETSRKYIGATYFHAVDKGSAAEQELVKRGYDVQALLRERVEAEREERELNWAACRGSKPARRSAGASAGPSAP